ncbi:polysaccharide deacetylase family protein [Actinacidiphila acididurans]|uniref:Polysaccharide deacetylase family protein n=1 Tax=Actinacidiphila acididurans TaxID=2784346 RepID=A0ABS2TXT8_9ACTN|nr:polysaccharide deacetylase family protein [Actinacidiphila acididurans]MBM9507897.1 polysaccharide deacetylase family protein [Actinacidiphila acididurans]
MSTPSLPPISRRALLVTASGSALAGCAGGAGGHVSAAAARPARANTPPQSSRTHPGHLPPGLPDQIEHGPRTSHKVALTFHGQGDPALAESLLTTAEKAGAHLTVMAVGTWLDAHPAMARRVLAGGHELGNHTQRHVDIGALDAAQARAEIEGCAEKLQGLTGSRGRWFRPSQARLTTPLVVGLARQAGYPHVLSYDVDSLDWTDPGPAKVRAVVAGQVRPGSVVSLHFGHPGTLAALPGILADLHRRGLRAVTTSELLT